MPVFLKKVKNQLQSGSDARVASFTPPKLLSRQVSDYTELVVKKKPAVKQIPEFKKGTLTFEALVKSEKTSAQSEPQYKVSAQFHRMKFFDEPTQFSTDISTKKVGKNEITKFHQAPSFSKNPVKMRCQCTDFRFKFEWDLGKADGLFGGKARGYDRITADPTKANFKKFEKGELGAKPRPFANPTGKLGYCKHLHSLFLQLKKEGLVNEK